MKTYSIEEQLSVLSPDQLEELKQELIKQRSQSNRRGILQGARGFGEGALLGLQGRPLSEGVVTGAKPAGPDKYEELLKMEELKNQTDPSRIMSRMELDEIKRKKEEQAKGSQDSQVAMPPTTTQPQENMTTQTDASDEPPMFITKTKRDRFGNEVEEQIDNPRRKEWAEAQKEQRALKIKSEEEKIKREPAVKAVKESAQQTISTIAEIKKGLSYFGAMGDTPPWSAEYSKKNWLANYNRLKDKLVVDLMLKLKSASPTGSTGFGQLSEKEGMRLENAATALQKGMKEEDALRYLNEIESGAKKLLQEESPVQNDGGEVPSVGSSFNGEKVLKVRKIQ